MSLIDKHELLVTIHKNPASNHAMRCVQLLDAINCAPPVDAVPVVRCRECINYKNRHVLTPDGQEKSYEEMPIEAFGGLDDIYVTMQYGINVGGKCMLDCGRGYREDKSVFRSPNDFCSYGVRKDKEDTGGSQTD